MNETDAQSQTRATRSEEISGSEGANDPRREAGSGEPRIHNEHLSRRVTGAIGTWTNSDHLSILTGGIIAQLIEDAEDRLGKTRECIEWYEREEKEQLERLENLQKLQSLTKEGAVEENSEDT